MGIFFLDSGPFHPQNLSGSPGPSLDVVNVCQGRLLVVASGRALGGHAEVQS